MKLVLDYGDQLECRCQGQLELERSPGILSMPDCVHATPHPLAQVLSQ